MNEYFAYIRVSTRRQGEQGASLPEQRRAIEKYAHEQNLSIIAWFEERETAAKRGRPIFSRMLSKLEGGVAHGVIIHKIDRSARNLKDWANLGDLIDAGVDVRFAHESIDLRTRGGRLAADIQAVVAADYIRNLRDEIRKGIQGRLRAGIYPMPAPIGYLDTGGGKPKAIDPVRGALVRMAFELYATGTLSLKLLRNEMRRHGLRTKGGNPLSVQSFWNILHNPFYIGLMRLKESGETHEGKHQPLISRATFDRVQAVASGKFAIRSTKHDFVFRCLVRCANCGRHLVGERQKGKYLYYRCHNEACLGTNVREELLDHVVQTAFSLLQCGPTEQRLFSAIVAKARGRDAERIDEIRNLHAMQLAKLEDRLTQLTDAYLDQTIDKDAFEARKRSLLGDKREILDGLNNLNGPTSLADTAFEKLELGNSVYSGYRLGNPAEKRAIIKSVCSNFSVQGKTPAIALQNPFQQVAEWRKSLGSGASHHPIRKRVRELFDILHTHAQEERNGAVLKAKEERSRLAA
jgi:DNA invertase Pin-like site-specific DNA recombinase